VSVLLDSVARRHVSVPFGGGDSYGAAADRSWRPDCAEGARARCDGGRIGDRKVPVDPGTVVVLRARRAEGDLGGDVGPQREVVRRWRAFPRVRLRRAATAGTPTKARWMPWRARGRARGWARR